MNDQSQDYGYPPYGSDSQPTNAPSGYDTGYGPSAPAPTNQPGNWADPNQPANPQGWGQPGWGQPSWGSQPVSDWPRASAGQDHGYPQPDNPNQGYPLSQYTEWANVSVPTPTYTSQLTQSSRGTVALVLALLALVISLVLSVWGGLAYLRADELLDGTFDLSEPTPGTEAAAATVALSMVGQLLPSLLGLIGLIVGLASLRTTSRGAGIAAIIVAVLAPLLSFLVFMGISISNSV